MNIFKEGFLYTSTTVIQKSIPFILMPFLTQVLSLEQYGIIAVFISTVSLYQLIVGASLNGFVKVVYHKTSIENFKVYVGNALIIICIMTLVSLLITWIFERNISGFIKIKGNYLYIALFVAFMKFIIDLRFVIYQTTRQALSYVKLQLTYPIIELFLIILLIFNLGMGAEGRVFSIALSALIIAILSTYLLFCSGLLNMSLNLIHIKRIIKFIIPMLPHSIALTIFTTFDKLILSSYVGLDIVGELGVALTLALPMWMLTESVNKAFMPWSLQRYSKKRFDEVVGASYLLLFGLFIVGIFYSIFLVYAFDIIVDQKFANTFHPALILIWASWFKLAYYFCTKILWYSEETKLISVITIFSGSVYFLILLISIENITLIKITLYMNVFYFLMFIGSFFLSQIKYPQPWGNFRSIYKVLMHVYKIFKWKK